MFIIIIFIISMFIIIISISSGICVLFTFPFLRHYCLVKEFLHRKTMNFFVCCENHVIEEIFKFFLTIFIILSVIEESKIRFLNFYLLECKDDLTSLFTSQSIAVVALSTAPVCRPRALSAVTPILCPLAPHPPASHQLPLACQAESNREPGQACQLPGLALHLYQSPGSWPSPWTTCP